MDHERIVNLTGEGIDLRKLLEGQETEFEIENEDFDEYKNPYFDNEEVLKNLNFECTFEGNESDSEDKTPFERMAINMEDITSTKDGGVLKKVMKHGTGNIIPDGALIRVHYNGYLEFSEEPFDSSRLRGKQLQVTLGRGEMLPGWEIAVKSMKRGEVSRFLVSPNYAYGKMGCPPRIPAESTVMLEVEVISVVERGASDEFENFTKEEKEKTTFDQMLKVADSLREVGNEAFNNRQMSQALKNYKKAINYLENSRLANEEEEKSMFNMCLKLYLNSSLCCLKINEYGKAAMYARKALQIDRHHVKAHFRLGRALLQMGEFADASGSLLQAQRLSPGNKEICNELQKLEENVKKFNAINKSICGKMFQCDSKSANHNELSSQNIDSDRKNSNALLEYVINKLQEFKEDPKETEFPLPLCLKSNEVDKICSLAVSFGLAAVEDKEGNLAIVKKHLR